ncbi:hypothetical protein [Streptomyces sp. URMC 123]|uniref:hypothetical protein n=1 Tax=Streptomyces sp. URMC 123 TaxID=3423403 RepID=UPI003F19F784
MEPLPPYRVLRPDAPRVVMELHPGLADTLVVSWHKDVLRDLTNYPYEAAALLRLALSQAQARTLDNFVLARLLMPLEFLTPEEVREAVDRLLARGFVKREQDTYVSVSALALDIIERAELPTQFRMKWNAAKASCPGPPPPTQQLTLI